MNVIKNNQRRNILIITDIFQGVGGSERNITQLMAGIDQKRFHLFLACIYAGNLAQDMRDNGYQVFTLNEGGIYTAKGMKNIIFLRKLIRDNGISLIVTYHEASDFYGLVLAKICHVPVISSRRDMGFKTKSHQRMAYRLVGRFFDAVLTVCEAVRQEAIRLGWFPPHKIYPIYNGVDLEEHDKVTHNYNAIKKNVGIETGHQVVGMVANIRRVKGIQYFIEAASIICKKIPRVEFIIVGADFKRPGYTQHDMELLAERLHIGEKIHFLGVRTDVAELISVFDVAVMSSLSEGFSNTILEYMVSSKPVVATDVGGNPEAVIHGETGFLVAPGNPELLATSICSLLENRILALRFGIAGRKRVEQKFSVETMIKCYELLFERVISERINKTSSYKDIKKVSSISTPLEHKRI